MKISKLLSLLLIGSILSISSCTTHYYIVRHAEKANSTSDTPLSSAGETRANDLKDFLADKNIKNIYVSNYQRTQQTAQPTADANNIVPVIYNAPGEFDQLITRLKSHGDNRSILVVNHSNSVPQIVDSLMKAPQGIVIPESDFDNIYHVKVSRALSVNRRLFRLTYGQPTN
jgi:broad specificity phosphatase PhoE